MVTLDELMKVIPKYELVEVKVIEGTTSLGYYNPYKDLPKEWHEYGVITIYSLFNLYNKETFISIEVTELNGGEQC